MRLLHIVCKVNARWGGSVWPSPYLAVCLYPSVCPIFHFQTCSNLSSGVCKDRKTIFEFCSVFYCIGVSRVANNHVNSVATLLIFPMCFRNFHRTNSSHFLLQQRKYCFILWPGSDFQSRFRVQNLNLSFHLLFFFPYLSLLFVECVLLLVILGKFSSWVRSDSSLQCNLQLAVYFLSIL